MGNGAKERTRDRNSSQFIRQLKLQLLFRSSWVQLSFFFVDILVLPFDSPHCFFVPRQTSPTISPHLFWILDHHRYRLGFCLASRERIFHWILKLYTPYHDSTIYLGGNFLVFGKSDSSFFLPLNVVFNITADPTEFTPVNSNLFDELKY